MSQLLAIRESVERRKLPSVMESWTEPLTILLQIKTRRLMTLRMSYCCLPASRQSQQLLVVWSDENVVVEKITFPIIANNSIFLGM